MKKMNVRFMAESAIIAALYVALTWLLAPISYGAIQFRISEIMILLVVLNPKYAYALIIGCLIANTTSTLGWYDIIFGTVATTIGLIPMLKVKKLEIAAIFPVISNAIIISLELLIVLNEPHLFWFNLLTIALGEGVVLYFLGIPFMLAISKNKGLVNALELDITNIGDSNKITLTRCLYLVLGMIGIIFYFAFPIYRDSEGIVYRAFELTYKNPWLCLFIVFSVLYMILGLFTKGLIKLIMSVIISLGLVTGYILLAVFFNEAVKYAYFYGYIIYLIALFVNSFYIYRYELLKN